MTPAQTRVSSQVRSRRNRGCGGGGAPLHTWAEDLDGGWGGVDCPTPLHPQPQPALPARPPRPSSAARCAGKEKALRCSTVLGTKPGGGRRRNPEGGESALERKRGDQTPWEGGAQTPGEGGAQTPLGGRSPDHRGGRSPDLPGEGGAQTPGEGGTQTSRGRVEPRSPRGGRSPDPPGRDKTSPPGWGSPDPRGGTSQDPPGRETPDPQAGRGREP